MGYRGGFGRTRAVPRDSSPVPPAGRCPAGWPRPRHRVDPDKLYTWPAYLWLERLRRRCPVLLLIITPDPAVAAWAAPSITSGPDNTTRPLVLGPDQIPHITEPAHALLQPALALLSARAHGHQQRGLTGFRAAFAVLAGLDTARRRMYIDLIFAGIRPDRAQQIKEELMLEGYTLDDIYPPGPWPTPHGDAILIALIEALEPRIKAHLEARIEPKVAARVEAHERQTFLLRLLARRNIALTPAQRAAIETCTAPAQLELWFDRAITVADADTLFADVAPDPAITCPPGQPQ